MIEVKQITIKGKRNGKEFQKTFDVKVRDDGYRWIMKFFGSTGYWNRDPRTIFSYRGKVLATDVEVVS